MKAANAKYGNENTCHLFIKQSSDVISRLESINISDNDKERARNIMILQFELALLHIYFDSVKETFDDSVIKKYIADKYKKGGF